LRRFANVCRSLSQESELEKCIATATELPKVTKPGDTQSWYAITNQDSEETETLALFTRNTIALVQLLPIEAFAMKTRLLFVCPT
jgi:hypothetical protein